MTSPRRLPTAQRRQQIASAALQIIAEDGVRRLTTVALAKRVGIADGTIFRHYKDKNEIVDAAINLFETTLEATFPPPGGEPLDRLGTFLLQRLEMLRKNRDLLRLAFNDRLAEAADVQGAERVRAIVGRSMQFVRDCLVESQNQNPVAHKAPVDLLVWMVIGVIHGASSVAPPAALGQFTLSNSSPEEIWAALEPLLRNTLKEQS